MEQTQNPIYKKKAFGVELQICEICHCADEKRVAKYKCPNCFLKYCSLNCWKEHKKIECVKEIDNYPITIDTTGSLRSALFPTDDTITSENLEKLKYNKAIKEMLRNPALRNIIEEVDKACNIRSVIQQAMMEPIFLEFADKCLSVVNKNDDYSSSSDDD